MAEMGSNGKKGGNKMRPYIGVTCNYDPLDDFGKASGLGLTGQDWNFVTGDYIYSLEEAGAIPVIIPYCRNRDTLITILERLDGILLTGGTDIDPNIYGKRPMPYCGRVIIERDEYELAIARYCYENKTPLLGICRGIQLLNISRGGTLYQDLGKEAGLIHCYMGDVGPRNYRVHNTTFTPGSLLHRVFGKQIRTNSFHHQGVCEPGMNVAVTAVAEDGAVEGIEVSGGPSFMAAVQWHPEMMFDAQEQKDLFMVFVEACCVKRGVVGEE